MTGPAGQHSGRVELPELEGAVLNTGGALEYKVGVAAGAEGRRGAGSAAYWAGDNTCMEESDQQLPTLSKSCEVSLVCELHQVKESKDIERAD